MSLVQFQGSVGGMKLLSIAGLLTWSLLASGCGGTEEATQDQKLGEPQTEAKKDEAKPYDQALTSFVGEDKKEEAKPATQPAAVDMNKPLDDLRTENTSLKQKIVKLEQDNRSLVARLSETEARLTSEKERADKAEENAKHAVTTQPAVTTFPSSASMAAYEEALRAFNSKKYDDALSALQSMLQSGVPEDLEDNCKYWIGETYFAKRKYADAEKSFEEVLGYKRSEKKADAQYMLAQCLDRLGKKKEAKDAFEKVVKDYPTSKLVKKAKARWAKL